MAVTYKRLFKLLIDKDLKKSQLEEMANISHYTMNQLNHGRHVNTETLSRICKALDCRIEDIMEFVDSNDE